MTFLSIFERYKFCFNTLIPLTGMETPARKRVRSKRVGLSKTAIAYGAWNKTEW
ncbi:hypothetical protein [Crocosphaera sp.]|uniref:hypothetical protein n=1 Tax=Crocosphaera sp. TaxID=2729996 RepID=UPI00258FE5EA|nr:hypothetical protein [Crocosphaera sp.]